MRLTGTHPTAAIGRALDLPRGSFYRRGQPAAVQSLKEALLALAGRWPTYGYRRLIVMLRREGHVVNGKRVRRLMHAMGLSGKLPARKRRTTDSRHAFPRYPNLAEGLVVVCRSSLGRRL
jgi:transposase InsO family protein